MLLESRYIFWKKVDREVHNQDSELAEEHSLKWFWEEFSNHMGSRAVMNLHPPLFNFFRYVKISHVEVVGALAGRTLCVNMEPLSGSVILVEKSGARVPP